MNKQIIFYFLLLTFHLPTLMLQQAGVLHFTFHVYAQQPTQVWVGRYINPNGGNCSMQNMRVDATGNVYVTGKTEGNGGNITTVKFNSSGVQQWAATYSDATTTGNDGASLLVDTAGNVYVICTSFNNFNPVYYVFIKYNLTGTMVWIKKFNFSIMGAPSSIVMDKIGYIYITGYDVNAVVTSKFNLSGDSIWVRKYIEANRKSAGIKILTNDSNMYIMGISEQSFPLNDDYLTLKYDATGNFKWAVKYTGPQQYALDAPYDIDIDRFSNIIVTGMAANSSPFYEDYGTVKYNWNGIQQWVSLYNGPGNYTDHPFAVVTDSIGNIFVTGYAYWGTSQGFKYSTIKYNSNGDSQWVRGYNSSVSGGAEAYSVKLDKIGNVYVTGRSLDSANNYNITTIKYSNNGLQQWVVIYPGTPFVGNNAALFVDENYNFYVGGGNTISGNRIDYIVVKYSQVIGINANTNNVPHAFKLYQNYPNPFNGSTKIVFNLPESGAVSLKIYDILGRELINSAQQNLKAGSYELIWDANILSSGVYFYQLTVNNKLINTKAMVLIK